MTEQELLSCNYRNGTRYHSKSAEGVYCLLRFHDFKFDHGTMTVFLISISYCEGTRYYHKVCRKYCQNVCHSTIRKNSPSLNSPQSTALMLRLQKMVGAREQLSVTLN